MQPSSGGRAGPRGGVRRGRTARGAGEARHPSPQCGERREQRFRWEHGAGYVAPGRSSSTPVAGSWGRSPTSALRRRSESTPREIDQRAGLPVGVGTRVEEGPLPAPPLGDAHDLAVGQKHLPRAAAREADQIAMGPGHRPTVVHGESTRTVAIGVERGLPPLADPLGRHRATSALPERVACGGSTPQARVWSPGTQQDARRRPHGAGRPRCHVALGRPLGRQMTLELAGCCPSTRVGCSTWRATACRSAMDRKGSGYLNSASRSNRRGQTGPTGQTGRADGEAPGAAPGGRSEIRLPQGIHIGEMPQPPQVPVGRGGFHAQRPTQLREEEVGLGQVVALTGRHHALDHSWVPPSLRRNDMVDGVGLLRAVDAEARRPGAAPSVWSPAACWRPAGGCGTMWARRTDGRHVNVERGRVEDGAVVAKGHRFGLARRTREQRHGRSETRASGS